MHLLVLTDDPALRDQLRTTLGDSACEFHPADPDSPALVLALSREPDTVLLDLAGANGKVSNWISTIREQAGASPLLVILGDGNRETGLGALKAGAWDYLARPLLLDEFAVRLRRAQDALHQRREIQSLRHSLDRAATRSLVVAESPALVKLKERLGVLAAGTDPILLSGEPGSGRKALAEFLHRSGGQRRASASVIPVGSLDRSLFQVREWTEARDRGTAVIDTIEALNAEDQESLATALAGGRRDPAGRPLPRIVAITGLRPDSPEFRERVSPALLERFGDRVFTVPPLRERPADIPALLAHFAQRTAQRLGRPVSISPRALAMLTVYPWPGNVREMESALERAATLGNGTRLEYADFGLVPGLNGHPAEESPRGVLELKPQVEAFERQVLLQALTAAKGNRQAAARLLGISLRTLFYKIKRYQVD